jgi:hypothetical protein
MQIKNPARRAVLQRAMLHCVAAAMRGGEATSSHLALRKYCAARLTSCIAAAEGSQQTQRLDALCRVAKACGGSSRRQDIATAQAHIERTLAPTTKYKGETPMAMLQHTPPPQQQNPAEARAPNETIKLIRKLRWIGMDEEAQKLQRELAEREGTAADSVVATPRDTD